MNALTFFDWFAGVGGIRLGLERAGMRCVGSCEVAPFSRAVYAARFERACERVGGAAPHVFLGDVTTVKPEDIPPADIWTAGFPCQDVSPAGLRRGLMEGDRSSLIWTLLALAKAKNDRGAGPEWLFLENVQGLLTGRDDDDDDAEPEAGVDAAAAEPASGSPRFPLDGIAGEPTWMGALLGALAELGYVGSWRVLDAKFFGVPQRRRRVFFVARRAGAGAHPGPILLEPEGVRGSPRPSRAPGPEVAGTVTASTGKGVSQRDRDRDRDLILSPALTADLGHGGTVRGDGDATRLVPEFAGTLGGSSGGWGFELDRQGAYVPEEHPRPKPPSVIAFDTTQVTHRENRSKCEPGGPAPALAARAHPPAIAFNWRKDSDGAGASEREASALGANHSAHDAVATESAVRRLLPRECERLQGLPDDWTNIPWDSNRQAAPKELGGAFMASDAARYKSIGNSVAEPVIRWIGRRWVAFVEEEKRCSS